MFALVPVVDKSPAAATKLTPVRTLEQPHPRRIGIGPFFRAALAAARYPFRRRLMLRHRHVRAPFPGHGLMVFAQAGFRVGGLSAVLNRASARAIFNPEFLGGRSALGSAEFPVIRAQGRAEGAAFAAPRLPLALTPAAGARPAAATRAVRIAIARDIIGVAGFTRRARGRKRNSANRANIGVESSPFHGNPLFA